MAGDPSVEESVAMLRTFAAANADRLPNVAAWLRVLIADHERLKRGGA